MFLQYLFTELCVVSHLGTFTDVIKLLEEFSGRISIDVLFHLNVSKSSNMYSLLLLGH